jgi:hypothetical protein
MNALRSKQQQQQQQQSEAREKEKPHRGMDQSRKRFSNKMIIDQEVKKKKTR